jgi:cytidylate kinase
MAPPRLVLVSGFTAAGKTTHSRLLAGFLGWRYVAMSEIRRASILGSSTAREEWVPGGDELRANDVALDLEIDRRIKEHIERIEVPAIVDAWLQPWLCELSGATRVWLDSDFSSRVAKAQVSRLRSGLGSSPSISATIARKDEFSVEHFRRLYGVDFGPDPTVFDLSLDNSAYISEPTIQASDDGIRRFAPVFNSRVGALVKARAHGS